MLGLITVPLCAAWSVVSWLLSPVPLTVLIVLAVIGYYRYTRQYNFWKERNVPGPPSRFPFGTSWDISIPFLTSMVERDRILYYDYGGKRYCGFTELQRPVLLIGDPDLIQDVLIKDFSCFTDRRSLPGEEVFDGMMALMKGREWKETRTVMTPTFSASKLRGMHHLTVNNAEKLKDYMLSQMQEEEEVDVWDACGRYAMDNIASCAFAVDCNSFKDPNCAFAKNSKELFAFSWQSIVRVLACMALPFGLGKLLPDPTARSLQFLSTAVKKNISEREQHGNSSELKDFLQLLLETKDKTGERVLSDQSVVMQSVLFLAAGYDTTARTLMFCMYSLAHNIECQRRAQEEVDEVLEKHDGVLTHDAVAELAYIDRVISETLRMYPLVVTLERVSTAEWTIPGTEATIPVGTLVNVPAYAIQHDPDIYPDPETFNPDRFLPEQKELRHPCTYLPFGTGPRSCIGMRFAVFEMKVALASVLRQASLRPGPHTPAPPLKFNPRDVVLAPVDSKILIKVVPRKSETEE